MNIVDTVIIIVAATVVIGGLVKIVGKYKTNKELASLDEDEFSLL